jgi:molybdate/tungstate transport system substrate-binding protein
VRNLVLAAALALPACRPDQPPAEELVVFAAASLARPVEQALRAWRDSSGLAARVVLGGSLDLARRITELREEPDIVILADEEIMTSLVVPVHATWYARFAGNKLVIAFTDQSRHADRLTEQNWPDILASEGVEVARADPARAPVGYRTLMAWELAARRMNLPRLPERLLSNSPERNVRANEAEVLALVSTGSADYAWVYESSARAAGLRTLELPSWMDFGTAADSAWYATARMKVPGRTVRDSVEVQGTPVSYVLTVASRAPHMDSAIQLARFLLGTSGRKALASAGLDVYTLPLIVGDGGPK